MANDNGLGNKAISLDGARKNPWILTTVVLALVLVAALFLKSGMLTGGAVSEDTAAEKVISFIEAQGGSAEIVSTEKNGSFYKVIVDYQEQEIPVFVTLDGKYLVPSLIPLDVQATADDAETPEQASAPVEVSKSDKPVVEAFVMSLCPYGTQIEKGILPVAELLGNKIDFKIKFVHYAMHDKPEIDENTRQYCIQKEQTSKFSKYLTCYLKAGKSDECLTSAGIDKTKLTACIAKADKEFNITANFDDKSSWLSGNYPRYNVNKAECDKYKVGGSPTLVINGAQVSSSRDSASLLKTICAAFNTAPEECDEVLSSTAPSPGFGEAAAASSGSTGGCGG